MAGKPVYLVVTPFFPSPASWRGPFCLDFVKALMRTGRYDVRVFVPGRGADYEIDGVRVFRFPTRQLPSNVLPFLFRSWNGRQFLVKARAVLGEAWGRVAVCHGHTANCAIYPLAMRREIPSCKALLHHHDPQSFGLNTGVLRHCWVYNLFAFPVLRRLHEAIDLHVFVSGMVERSFRAAPDASWTAYAGYRRQMRLLPYRPVRVRRSVVLHNGVDPAIFGGGEAGRSDSRPRRCDGTFTIGCVGNFVDWKGQETLIRAVRRLKGGAAGVGGCREIRVVFVGSGPLKESCERLAREAEGADGGGVRPSVRFEFRREVTHERLPDFYRSLDLFVLPSYFEGFGCVFTEAFACGVPFVCCRGQGVSELTPDAWMVDPGDVAGLAEKIAWVVRERPEMRLTGEWRIDPLVRRFVAFVDSAL